MLMATVALRDSKAESPYGDRSLHMHDGFDPELSGMKNHLTGMNDEGGKRAAYLEYSVQ